MFGQSKKIMNVEVLTEIVTIRVYNVVSMVVTKKREKYSCSC